MKMHDALFEASRDPLHLAVRRPEWNDESRMVLYKGRPLMIIGGRPSPECVPLSADTLADDWIIIQGVGRMGILYKLDRSGHGEVAKWGDDAESRAAGAVAFDDLAAKGYTMFDITDPQEGRMLKAFDPEAREVLASPRLVAG